MWLMRLYPPPDPRPPVRAAAAYGTGCTCVRTGHYPLPDDDDVAWQKKLVASIGLLVGLSAGSTV